MCNPFDDYTFCTCILIINSSAPYFNELIFLTFSHENDKSREDRGVVL